MSFDCPTWPPDWPEILSAAQSVIRSGQWGQYHCEICAGLQARIAGIFGASKTRLCCSGTAALEIALRVSQLAQGEDVVLAAYDFPGNFRTIELLGARPVLLDVAPNGLSIDADQLESFANEPGSAHVRAVIATHLYGCAADVNRLRQICDARDWVLIEDACQAIGMLVGDRAAGSIGHIGTFSFGGSKPVSAGGGGAILVQSSRIAARLGGWMDRPGEVFPLSPLQAAVIGPQLDRLDELTRIRLATVEFLQHEVIHLLKSWHWLSHIQPCVVPAYYKIAWLAQSDEHRQRILSAAQRENLPMGPGFRSMSRSSQRRCGKPYPTPRSEQFGERLFVLDHRALLLNPSDYPNLADSLKRVHDVSE